MLEPYAFSELLWYFGFSSLNGLACLEGRSYFSGRIGEHVFDESFNLVDDGLDAARPPQGVRLRRRTQAARHDRRERRREGRRLGPADAPSGPATVASQRGTRSPRRPQGFGALPLNMAVTGGDATRDELVERIGDGIYVTRLHYLGVVDPREGIITGMTRDGTFQIEGGKVTKPLVNLRFTTSFPKVVENSWASAATSSW